jgi:Tat protein translocase TatB subunit
MIGTLGAQEMMLILVLALIVFGPRKLPDIGKSVGKMLAEFRRASNDFKRTVEQEVEAEKTAVRRPAPRLEPPAAATTPVGPARTATDETSSEATEPASTATADAPAAAPSSSGEPADEAQGSPSTGAPPAPSVERPS